MASGIDNRRDPYTYFLSGNLGLDLYDLSIPVSFSFSNQKFAFQQPFNQYGLHPTYKWATAHLGWASMSFSPYTLSGHLFRGAGLELAPESGWRFSAMYGRLQKATDPVLDTLALVSGLEPAYQRLGGGFRAGYENEGDQLFLSLFKAGDKQTSLAGWVPDSLDLLPVENLALSLSGQKKLFNRLNLTAEYGTTAYTRDRWQEVTNGKGLFSLTSFIMQNRATTEYHKALKGALTYTGDFYSVGFAYERVDPGYRTLGAYYFNNDLENISLNTTTALFSGKVNLGINLGMQRDNLDEDKVSSMRRLASAFSLAYAASERLNLAANYSNFQTVTNIRPLFEQLNQLTPYQNIDTLNYTQLSKSANLTATYILSMNKSRRQSLSLNGAYQQASDMQGNETSYAGSRFYNANGSYSINFTEQQLSLSLSANYSRNVQDSLLGITVGPVLSASKSFLNKTLRTSLSLGYNQSSQQQQLLHALWNTRATAAYTILKKHSLSLSLAGLKRETVGEQKGFSELTATLGYNYRFGGR